MVGTILDQWRQPTNVNEPFLVSSEKEASLEKIYVIMVHVVYLLFNCLIVIAGRSVIPNLKSSGALGLIYEKKKKPTFMHKNKTSQRLLLK